MNGGEEEESERESPIPHLLCSLPSSAVLSDGPQAQSAGWEREGSRERGGGGGGGGQGCVLVASTAAAIL